MSKKIQYEGCQNPTGSEYNDSLDSFADDCENDIVRLLSNYFYEDEEYEKDYYKPRFDW